MTVREIAAITKLSPATIYRAMKTPNAVSKDVLIKIREVVGEIKEKPDKLRQVYIVLPYINSFYTSLIVELITIFTKEDIQTTPFITNMDTEKERDFLSQIHFSSRTALIWSPADEDASFAFLNRKKNKPMVVLLNRKLKLYKSELSVLLDGKEAIQIAVDTLIKEGNNNILLINTPKMFMSSDDISDNFLKVISKYPNANGNIIIAPQNNWDSAYNAISARKELLMQYDAVISGGEQISYGLLRIMEELGYYARKDIRLITFDYAPIFEALSLSMVYFSPSLIAKKTAEFMIEKTNNREHSVEHNFLPQLYLLGSEKKQN